METIFDFSPTKDELKAIGIYAINLAIRHGITLTDPIQKENYLVSQSDAHFDLALLFELRDDQKTADEFWANIPERHQEYLLGFDELILTK